MDHHDTATTQLCGNCSGLRFLELVEFRTTLIEIKDEWSELKNLRKSGMSGCGFCRLLRENLLLAPDDHQWAVGAPTPVPVSISITQENRWDHKVAILTATVYYTSAGWRKKVQQFQFQVWADSSATHHRFYPAPTVKVLSKHNIKFIREAINNSEMALVPPDTRTHLPTRLLDLGPTASIETSVVRLIITEDIPVALQNTIQYATLSYCWGDPEIARLQSKTTSQNLKTRLEGFALTTLSPVIQDAIRVCFVAGIRYLWVDALCILQGCDEVASNDWNIQSQRMSQIYGDATITICAASSNSCQEGFLRDRDIPPALHIRLNDLQDNQSLDATREVKTYSIIPCRRNNPILLHPTLKGPEYGGNTPLDLLFTDSKWHHRGWVHQEISFSPRLLIFGSHMILFSSQNRQITENGCQISAYSGNHRRTSPLTGVRVDYIERQPFQSFSSQIQIFSSKHLTFETDRLPAVAGLASKVAEITRSRYLAGLWQNNLVRDLLFTISPGPESIPFRERIRQLSMTESNNARPSWSWTGIRGRYVPAYDDLALELTTTYRDDVRCKLNCQLLDAPITMSGSNPYGQVKSASLKIKARVISLFELEGGWHPGILEPENVRKLGDRTTLSTEWDTDTRDIDDGIAASICLVYITESALYLHGRNSGRYGATGLILYPAGASNEYYRIGRWHREVGGDQWTVDQVPFQHWSVKTITLV